MAVLALALTVAVYLAAARIPRIPPILTASVALALLIPALGITPAAYTGGTRILVALLAPAVVALALPFHRRRAMLAKSLVPTLAGLIAGAAAGITTAVLLGRSLGLPTDVLRALAPRAATAPVAASVAAAMHADPHLAVAAGVAGGILGAVLAPLVLRLAGTPHAAGLGLGVAAHGIGTAHAAALNEEAGAAAATAMALNALTTAVLAPILVPLLLR